MSLPNGRYPDLSAFRVIEEAAEELEEGLQMRLEALDDVFKNGEEDVDADFTMRGLLRQARLLEEGHEGGPVAEGDLNGGDGGNNTGDGMADEVAGNG